jgi:hypothetical protein
LVLRVVEGGALEEAAAAEDDVEVADKEML